MRSPKSVRAEPVEALFLFDPGETNGSPSTSSGRTAREARLNLTTIVPTRVLASALFGLIAIPQLLLWRFLGFGLPWLCVGAVALAGLGVAVTRAVRGEGVASVRLVAALGLLSVGLFVLGGEGRFFYANTDWQVRDAVLRDLVVYPWPWAYTVRAAPDMLRVPLGMYLLPALVGKADGYRAAEFALLAQNAALLTTLLALGAALFADARRRAIALATVVAFSGMDVIGMLLVGGRLDKHLEWWSVPQYSSDVTQIFWVPQHAMAGWAGALLYLLWRERRVPLAGFLAVLPLLALWSPLALMGLMPFAAQAGLAALWRRAVRPADVLLPAAAVLAAVPGLLYLAAGSGAVGGRGVALPFGYYAVFIALEVGVFLLAAATVGRRGRFGGACIPLVTAILLAAPYIQVGHNVDFVMRASIPALLILALQIADILGRRGEGVELRLWQGALLVVLAIGAVTPLSEARRAILRPPSPSPHCSYFGIVPDGAPTYVAPLASLAPMIAPAHPALVRPNDPARCWDTPWPNG